MTKIKCAIIGPGNIGTDLLYKLLRSDVLEPVWMVGVDPTSAGLARARELGLKTTEEGVDGLVPHVLADGVQIAFDATSAYVHADNSRKLNALGVVMIDLTPAAIGPLCVPPVNLATLAERSVMNVNMVTCAGQATIPMVNAVSAVQAVEYAEIIATVEPWSPGEEDEDKEQTYLFENKVTGGRIPKEYIPSVDHGISASLNNGTLAGFPLLGLKVTLEDGKSHDVDSSEMAFKIAAQSWFREVIPRAKPVLLEPIMAVEVVTPENYMGDVVGDLNSRRGRVGQMEARGGNQVVTAQVPLSEMFGYATDLRSRTQGRATYTMQFDSYQQTPGSVQEEIVSRIRGE